MKMSNRTILVLAFGLSMQAWLPAQAAAAPADRTVLAVRPQAGAAVTVRPDREDWLYALGERAHLRIDGPPGTKISYRLGAEQFEGQPVEAVLPEGGLRLAVPSPSAPGFVRCTVTPAGRPDAEAMVTIGFAPERLVPTQTEPADFDAFWRRQKAMLDAVPPEYSLMPAPKLSNDAVEVFYLRYRMFSNWAGPSHFYGVLSVPRGAGPYPVVLYLPGAGVRPYFGQTGMARKGAITLELGVHGIPLDLPREVYQQLERGVLEDYNRYHLDDRNRYYYRRIFLGVLRGADYLASHPKWNGKGFIATGGSQGGMLSLMLAGLDKRVSGVAAAYPAYSDVTGYLHGRAGGWPGLFKPTADGGRGDEPVDPKRITSGYYDSVNFARRVRVPGFYFMGFNDTVTPPTSVYAAFNTVAGPREIVIAPEQGHKTSAEQQKLIDAWILGQLGLPN